MARLLLVRLSESMVLPESNMVKETFIDITEISFNRRSSFFSATSLLSGDAVMRKTKIPISGLTIRVGVGNF